MARGTVEVSCTGDLRAEHRAVLTMLDVTEAMEQRFEEGLDVPPEDIGAVLGFLAGFVDECHHHKEEDLLFPALMDVEEHDDSITRLETEHLMGREYVGRISERLERYGTGDVTVARGLAEDLHGYAEMLRRHIGFEDDVLFPRAEEELPDHIRRELAERYGRFERETIGEGRHEAFHADVRRLRERYLAGG